MQRRLQPGDRIQLSGSYDPDDAWLHGKEFVNATITAFCKEEGEFPEIAFVKLEKPLRARLLKCSYASLNLRTEKIWEDEGVVHVTLHRLDPQIKPTRGAWVEGAASYRKL